MRPARGSGGPRSQRRHGRRGPHWRCRGVSRRLLRAAPVAAAVVVFAVPGSAVGAPQVSPSVGKAGALPAHLGRESDGAAGRGLAARHESHDGAACRRASQADAENVELVSKLELEIDEFGPGGARPDRRRRGSQERGVPELVGQPFEPATGRCERGGFFSVDISDPAQPASSSPSEQRSPSNYHGEGAHAITFPDGRDMLAVNNEFCTRPRRPPGRGRRLRPLRRQRPERSPPSSSTPRATTGRRRSSSAARRTRQARMPDRPRVPLGVHVARRRPRVPVGVDNAEQARTDVDIFDITDPSRARRRREYDLDAEFPIRRRRGRTGSADNVFDRLTTWSSRRSTASRRCSPSYWDGGYVLLERRATPRTPPTSATRASTTRTR